MLKKNNFYIFKDVKIKYELCDDTGLEIEPETNNGDDFYNDEMDWRYKYTKLLIYIIFVYKVILTRTSTFASTVTTAFFTIFAYI